MRFKNFLFLLLICVFSLCISLSAFAQSPEADDIYTSDKITLPKPPKPVPGEPTVGAAISPMRWGQVAPFSGVLLSATAVATVVTELNSIQDLIKIEIARERKLQIAQCDHKIETIKIVLNTDKKILQASLDARNKDIAILNDRLKKSEDSAPNLALWIGGSFVVGVIVTVLTTVASSYATGAR